MKKRRAQALLVADLLGVSKVVSGKVRLSITATNLWTMLESALEAVKPAAAAKGVHVARTIAEALPLLSG